jgi:DNA-binding response OmpR family regulator
MAETILIIANELEIRNQLVGALSEYGYRFFTTADGGGAILQVGFIQPQLVILDLASEGQDRWRTLQRIRELFPVPVIVLTASENDDDRSESLDRGADCCLIQPFSAQELQARVRALLRRVRYGDRVVQDPQSVSICSKHAF